MSFINKPSVLGNNNSVLGNRSLLNNLALRGAILQSSSDINPPLNLTGVANLTTVTLSWTAPSSVGGVLYPTSYDIFYILNGVTTFAGNVLSPQTTFTVSGLNQYTSYLFYVTSVNSDIASINSNPITLNTTCFLEGTKILYWNKSKNCEEYVAIENLRKGMEVKTALNGYVKIEEIGRTTVYNFIKNKGNKDGLYKLTKDSCPELFEDLYMTGAHAKLVDDFKSDKQKNDVSEMYGDIYITGNKYRLPICFSDEAEPFNEEGEFNIWHFALENDDYYGNYGVYANGLLVESTSIRYMKEIFDGDLLKE
jgi:hypothetical protein